MYIIWKVCTYRENKTRGQNFSLITVRGAEYTFLSTESKTIAMTIKNFLDGLRKRSVYAVGLQRFTLEGSN